MGAMSRNKGKVGEREAAALLTELTGHQVKRRVRNLAGEDDLVGLPGWSLEVKRYASATPSLLAGWWAQAVEQAKDTDTWPLLLYRVDRGEWVAVWPAALHCPAPLVGLEHTLSATPSTWWRMVAPPCLVPPTTP